MLSILDKFPIRNVAQCLDFVPAVDDVDVDEGVCLCGSVGLSVPVCLSVCSWRGVAWRGVAWRGVAWLGGC